MKPALDEMTEEELAEIFARCEAASEGPWYPRATDDEIFSSALFVSTQPGKKTGDGLYHDNRRGMFAGYRQQEPPSQVIAITLLQNPHMADVADGNWDENTLFIAHAREDVPRLIREIRRLRAKLADKEINP